MADAMLAQKFRWPTPVPLLVGKAFSPLLKTAEPRRRTRPGAKGWGSAVLLAYAQAAAEACDLAGDLARRAARLLEVAPNCVPRGRPRS
jgi:hypothetical protein